MKTRTASALAVAGLLLVAAGPAFALGDLNASQTANGGAGGSGGTGYGGTGGSAGAVAGANAGSFSGGNRLGQQQGQNLNNRNYNANSARQGQGQGQIQGQDQDQQANNSQEGDKTDINAYAISYTDAAPPTVAATVTNDVAITTWGVKILGPVFGMTDQHVHDLPGNMLKKVQLVYDASVNDGTDAGKAKQHATIATMCAVDEYRPLVEVRLGDDACDDLRETFARLK